MLLLALLSLVIAYDYQSLEITWRPTDCKFNKCELGYVSDDFNIHGLWPDYFNGSYPHDCKNLPFDITAETKELLKFTGNHLSRTTSLFGSMNGRSMVLVLNLL